MELKNLKNETEKVWGIIKYDIIYDTISVPQQGAKMYITLNGLWTNNNSDRNHNVHGALIGNEIARKNNSDIKSDDVLIGDYDVAFIEIDKNYTPITEKGKLKISKNRNASYTVEWHMPNKIFEGVGFKIDKQLIVTFWHIE